MRPKPWKTELDMHGGYDCTRPGVHILDADGDQITTIDAGNFGGGNWYGRDFTSDDRIKVLEDIIEHANVIVEAVNKA